MVTAMKMALKKWIWVLSISIVITPTHLFIVKCEPTLLEPNSYEPYSSSERERKFSVYLFTSSIKREIRHFPIVVMEWRKRNIQKSVMHVQSWCLPIQPVAFLTFSLSSLLWHLKVILKSLFIQDHKTIKLTLTLTNTDGK